jgi:hypothetical protein
MKRTTLVLSVSIGCSLLMGGGAVAGQAGPGLVREGISIDLGRRDFRNYCAACHGIEGKADGTLGEFLTLSIPDLTQLSRRNGGQFPAERVRQVIDGRADVKVHGLRDMPVWGDWFNAEAAAPENDRKTRELIVQDRIQSLANYIESIQQN